MTNLNRKLIRWGHIVFKSFLKLNSWRIPHKSRLIIYDSVGAELFLNYKIFENAAIIDVRGDNLNFTVCFRAVFFKNFWRGNLRYAYEDAYIRMVRPVGIVTYIDNSIFFYKLKERHPKIKTFSIQNGIRHNWLDANLMSDRLSCDYFFVFNEAMAQYTKKFIKANFISIGSFKNNQISFPKNHLVRNSVVFISQYIPGVEKKFYFPEEIVLSTLRDWCCSNNLQFIICGRSSEPDEIHFYERILGKENWAFRYEDDQNFPYWLCSESLLTVTIDSTLGYENLSRGKKTFFISCRAQFSEENCRSFGWPKLYPDRGTFWSNHINNHDYLYQIEKLVKLSDDEWVNISNQYIPDLMKYYSNNNITLEIVENNIKI